MLLGLDTSLANVFKGHGVTTVNQRSVAALRLPLFSIFGISLMMMSGCSEAVVSKVDSVSITISMQEENPEFFFILPISFKNFPTFLFHIVYIIP